VTSTTDLLALAAESLELALTSEPKDPAQLAAVCRLIGELGERLTQETLLSERAAAEAA